MEREPDTSWEDDRAEYLPKQPDGNWEPIVTTETEHEPDDGVQTLLFTATNPSGTVAVTSLISGQPVRVELDQAVSRTTERELADEITMIAKLARLQALASQHVLASTVLTRLGHDPVESRSFLEHELRLPSPEAVRDERARMFATHHTGDLG